MIVGTHGFLASSIVQSVFLLDAYPNAAAAYSLRKLRTAYTGSAIRVRRTDLQELDIGFTSTGALDTTALLAFTGTGALDNGFVTTWYDQSGNAQNATQTSALSQPQIVNAGSILLKYGKPNIVFTQDFLNLPSSLILNDQVTMSIVMNSSATGGVATGFINYNSSPQYNPELRIGNGDGLNDYYNNTYVISANISAITGGFYFYQRLTGYTSTIYRNNVFIATGTQAGTLASGLQKFTIGEYVNETRNGNISEFVIYPSNQSSNRNGIATNTNLYYGIY
jgi:hypothetical protein